MYNKLQFFRKTMGRPKKNPDEKKSEQIVVNITMQEKNKIQKIADEEGLSLSQLCLRALKKQKYL